MVSWGAAPSDVCGRRRFGRDMLLQSSGLKSLQKRRGKLENTAILKVTPKVSDKQEDTS
jgi:hypothetical protein